MHSKMRSARPVAQLRQGRTDWYRIKNFGGGAAALYIYDEIGYWGVTASDLVEELSELTGVTAIDVHINSPGGEVFDGLAIMNSLRAHPATVTTYVDGMAASIASVIAMAGERVVMGPHSQMMIHEGSGLCIGDADEMRKMADLLDFQSDNIAGVYQAKAGGNVEDWRALMRAETWFTAEEAVAAGLADEVAKPKEPAGAPAGAPAAMDNSWDLSVFRFAGRGEAPAPPVGNAVGAAEAAPVRTGEPAPGTQPSPAAETVEPNAETGQDTDGTPAGQQDTDDQDTSTAEDGERPTSEDTVQDTSSVVSDTEDTPADAPTDDDDWAAMTASLIADDADDWSALVSNLTTDSASSSAADA
ncbi:head maturation protease, ClpP-related [Streptomyces lydicus]|uniref:head maturation protease, ClpP-related n=1 Tax=Streptomyces lydicus TaxID=47763 RepID=UPI0037A5EFF2